MPLSLVVAGGGTGGHVEPAMNMADYFSTHIDDTVVTALGTNRGLETSLVPARGYPLELIPAVPLPRKPSGDLLTLPGRMRSAVRAVRDVFDRVDADVLIGFGGYVSLPAYLAARGAKLPYVVHEANARPGLANKVGALFTDYIAENYAGSMKGAQRVGLPLRTSVAGLDRSAHRVAAAEYFDLDPDLPTVLVFGGSQGARRLNEAVWGSWDQMQSQPVQVLHAVGPRTEDAVVHPAQGSTVQYRWVPFIDRMDLAYSIADLAVCRAGAMTCGEVAAVGLPAIYVPFPIGNGEQRFNAAPVVEAGGGLLVDDADMTSQRFSELVTSLMGDQERLRAMSEAAAEYGVRDGDRRIADMAMQALGRASGGL